MKLYIYVVDESPKAWGLTHFNVRAALDEQNISTPENPAVFAELDLSEFGYFEYHVTPIPEHDPATQSVIDAEPLLIDEKWCQQWAIGALQVEVIAQNLASAKASLVSQIDDHIATIQSKWTRFWLEYSEREAAALSYKNVNYQGTPDEWVSDFANSAGLTFKNAADRILLQAESLRPALKKLGGLRMRKYEISGAPNLSAAQVVYDDILAKVSVIAAGLK